MAAPKKAMPKPKGRASIYKGTDKTTNTKDRVRSGSQAVVYKDGSKEKLVKVSGPKQRTVMIGANARVRSEKKGNQITTTLSANDPLLYKGYMTDSFPRYEQTITTLGKDGRRESVVKRSGQNNRANYVVSETQLARGTVRKGAVGKKKAY
jgi:hypothetical protein